MKIFQSITLAVFSVAVLVTTFFINLNVQVKNFENTAKSKEVLIKEFIEVGSMFIDAMTIYGNSCLSEGGIKDSILYSLLGQDEDSNSYNLDIIGSTEYQISNGNLTGIGNIPKSSEEKDEINLAINYGSYFSRFKEKNPEIEWIYYTSENDFVMIYPWISSKKFKYSTVLKEKEFYTYALPKNNKKPKEAVWTPVYKDEAGGNNVVTLSSPIYSGNVFAGVVSLDITTDYLSSIIDSPYQSFLVDTKDSIVAASLNVQYDAKETKFSALTGLPSRIEKGDMQSAEGWTKSVGDYYVYSVGFTRTPWQLYFIVPVWNLVRVSILYSLPMMAICILLFLTSIQVIKRRRAEIRLSESLNELKSYQQLLKKSATHDFLTNTCNRRGLNEYFEALIQSSGENKIPVSFIMGDIDGFKYFNDTFGHNAGDKVLIEMADIMKENVEANDVVCRWGGEEFVIMLAGKDYETALTIAEKVRKQIEKTVIPWEGAVELKVTMTFGVSEYNYKETMQSAIAKADLALYIGKEKGKNKVVGSLNQKVF